MDEEFDHTEQKLIAAEMNCLSADSELRAIKAQQMSIARDLVNLGHKHEELKLRRRKLGADRKAEIGLAFYKALEEAGLNEVLTKYTKDVSQNPALVRKAMRQVSTNTGKSLAAMIVQAIEKSLSEAQKQSE